MNVASKRGFNHIRMPFVVSQNEREIRYSKEEKEAIAEHHHLYIHILILLSTPKISL